MYDLSEVDYTAKVIEQLFPAEPAPTNLDKGIDLIKALTCTTIPGVIGSVFQTGLKTFQVIQNSKYKERAIKYVSNMYEVQKFSELEMKRLELAREQNKSITLYIDRTFQATIDELSKNYSYNMQKLKNNHEAAIHKINTYAEIELSRINKQYASIISEQESKCVLYRQFLLHMYKSNVTPADLLVEGSKQYFQLIQKAYDKGDGDSSSTQALFNNLSNYINFIGDPNKFVSFNDFIGLSNYIGRY